MKYIVLSFSILFSLIFAEVIIRMTGKVKTYTEINYNRYASAYHDPYYYSPGEAITKTIEFEYIDHLNSYGLRDDEILPKNKNHKRVLILGDSFTFGVGVSREKNWISTVKQYFQKTNPKIEIINGGTPGEDIFSAQEKFTTNYNKINPDAVIYVLNTSDINDLITRGDDSRYKTGILHPKTEKLWEYSHLYRLIMIALFKWDMNLNSPKENQLKKEWAIKTLPKAAAQFSQTLHSKKIKFALFFHPYPWELDSNNHQEILHELLKSEPQLTSYDLFPYFFDKFKGKNILEYSYLHDGHYNEIGYKHFAEIFIPHLEHFLSY